MNVKVIELLVEILDALNKNVSIEDLNNRITKENKFDTSTISAAFSLIYEKTIYSREKIKEESKSFRIFSTEEFLFLGEENANYLLHLTNIGLIEKDDLEFIIEQLTLYPSDKLTKKEINMMILYGFVEKSTNILPGSRITLFPSDTIN